MSRFKAGTSGNPKGRPRKHTATAESLRAKLAERAADVVQTIVDAALAGDLQAARLVLERIVPALRPQAQPVEVLGLATCSTLTEKATAILAAVAAGEVPADIGAQLLAALGTVARVVEIDELTRRIEALEANHDAPA